MIWHFALTKCYLKVNKYIIKKKKVLKSIGEAASILFKLFVYDIEKRHTTDTPLPVSGTLRKTVNENKGELNKMSSFIINLKKERSPES